jgi:hypothetical protein
MDFWLYFFKNGAELDADALPEPMDKPDHGNRMLKVRSSRALGGSG